MENPGLKISISPGEHVLGFRHAPVTLLMYGDYECPHSTRAQSIIDDLMRSFGTDLRFVYRHFPLKDAHPCAELAAKAAEAAYGQGRFWEMHRMMYAFQDELNEGELIGLASELGLNISEFKECIRSSRCGKKVDQDLKSALQLGLDETPALFINGARHQGPVEMGPLRKVIQQWIDEETIRRAI